MPKSKRNPEIGTANLPPASGDIKGDDAPQRSRRWALIAAGALLAPVLLDACSTEVGGTATAASSISRTTMPTVTETSVITVTETPGATTTDTSTSATTTATPPAGTYTKFQEPLVRDTYMYADYHKNGTGKGIMVGHNETMTVNCVAFDSAFAKNTDTHGLWYEVAEGPSHGKFFPAQNGFNGDQGNLYDPQVPPCDANVSLPPPHN